MVSVTLSLEALGSELGVLDIFWFPNSEVCLAVVTDVVINIYDLSTDPICPTYCFRHEHGEPICAATPYSDMTSMGALVMLRNGSIFKVEFDPESGDQTGPGVLDAQLMTPEGFSGKAGQALYYSLKSHLLVCSFRTAAGQGQHIVIARLSLAPGATHITDWVKLDMAAGSGNGAGGAEIDRFMDVGNGWGQLLLASSTAGALGLVQMGESAIRVSWLHTPLTASPERSSQRVCGLAASSWTRPAIGLAGMMVLLEDGSLQHWAISEQHALLRQPDFLFSMSPAEDDDKPSKGSNATFPVDFFEKGVCVTSKIKFSGDLAVRAPPSESGRRQPHPVGVGASGVPPGSAAGIE